MVAQFQPIDTKFISFDITLYKISNMQCLQIRANTQSEDTSCVQVF